MATPQYRYKLLSEDSLFRLFRIKQSQPDFVAQSDEIEIILFEADFNEPLEFDVVSYP